MKTKMKYTAIIMAAFLMFSGAAIAQNSSNSTEDDNISDNTSEPASQLGEGVRAFNFNIKGLPATPDSAGDSEVDGETEYEIEPDSDENFTISEDEAQRVAIKELGSTEWDLVSSERGDNGVYEFDYKRGESEATVEVDGSTGKVVTLEGEVEYESETREESVVQLSGFVEFTSGGYGLEVESEESEGEVDFVATIKEPEEDATTQQIDRIPVKEDVEVESGKHTVNLEVVRNGEKVLERTREINIPETEKDDSETNYEKAPEDMTREELVEEVEKLREKVRELTEDTAESGDERRQGPPEDIPSNPGEGTKESGKSDNASDEKQRPPSEAPGNSSNRPGFVNDLLGGLFG